MGRFIKITLDDKTRAALEAGYRRDQSHTFRQRCQVVLLKAQGRKSKEIALMFGCGEKSVNDWLHRYLCEGINGLRTRAGRGLRERGAHKIHLTHTACFIGATQPGERSHARTRR